jgi:hypothetical protein
MDGKADPKTTTHHMLNGHAFDRTTGICAYCKHTLAWFRDHGAPQCNARLDSRKDEGLSTEEK